MSQENNIRLKIQIETTDLEFIKNIEVKFWYFLDTACIQTIEGFKRDLMKKIYFIKNSQNHKKVPLGCMLNNKFSSIKLSMDAFELPNNETTKLFRQMDIIVIHLIKQFNHHRNLDLLNNKKRKQIEPPSNSILPKRKTFDENNENWDDDTQTSQNKTLKPEEYTACIIGTSMVKHFSVKDIFPDQKCFFKSISGGSIRDVHNILKSRELLLAHVKTFVITAGSNDMDSENDANTGINDFLEMVQYLNEIYSDAKFIFNKLVPRTQTKFTDLKEFEERRIQFNNFLEKDLTFLKDYIILGHLEFEDVDKLSENLSDGVHLSVSKGVPLYVEEIKKSIH